MDSTQSQFRTIRRVSRIEVPSCLEGLPGTKTAESQSSEDSSISPIESPVDRYPLTAIPRQRTHLTPQTSPKYIPTDNHAPGIFLSQLDGPPVTDLHDSHRTSSIPNNSNTAADLEQDTADRHVASDYETQPDGVPSGRRGHNITAISPPTYQQSVSRPSLQPKRKLRIPRLSPSQQSFGNGWKAFVYWLRLVWLDILFMALASLVLGAIYQWAPVYRWERRHFPVEWDDTRKEWVGPVQLSYPFDGFVISWVTAALVSHFVPFAILLITQLWLRDSWDLHAAMFGLGKCIIMVQFISVSLKVYIGELRPVFLSICGQIDIQNVVESPHGYPFATPLHCAAIQTPKQKKKLIQFAMTSFPSGHTATAFAVGTFMALYLNAKLKAFSDYHMSFWKMIAVLGPLIGAAFVAGSFVSDRIHHVHDILLSIPIGVFIAMVAYRAHYASLFDYRTNHMYLPWSATNRSVNKGVDTPAAVAQNPPKRHKTAVPWPRAPKSRTQGENQRVGTGLGLDGAGEPLNRRVHGPGALMGGRTRQELFPQEEATMAMVGNEIAVPDGSGGIVRYPTDFAMQGDNTSTGVQNLRRRTNLTGGAMV